MVFQAPAGQKLDTRYGPSTRLLVSSTPPELLLGGDGAGTDLSRALEIDPAVAEGVLHVSAMAASCDDDPDERVPGLPCPPAGLGCSGPGDRGGDLRLPLVLAGMDQEQ